VGVHRLARLRSGQPISAEDRLHELYPSGCGAESADSPSR
jgi:hypothetical protein